MRNGSVEIVENTVAPVVVSRVPASPRSIFSVFAPEVGDKSPPKDESKPLVNNAIEKHEQEQSHGCEYEAAIEPVRFLQRAEVL